MDLIEVALSRAGLGSWVGAEVGTGVVNFGFQVTDFETAEKLVRATVEGTAFANIREIERSESDEDLSDQEDEDPINREGVQETLTELGFDAVEKTGGGSGTLSKNSPPLSDRGIRTTRR